MAALERQRAVGLVMVGDELLDGRTLESNSRYLIERLRNRRARVGSIRIVADKPAAIVEALAASHRESVAVVVSGGLGPTPDDCTREALALLVGEDLIFDEALAEELKRRYAQRHRPMAESNLRQAQRTAGGRPIPNPRGSAPGLLQLHEGVPIVLLPGVPAELRSMWEATAENIVVPLVENCAPDMLLLRTARLPESVAADRAKRHDLDPSLCELTFCVTQYGVDLLLLAKNEDVDLASLAQPLIEELGEHLFAVGDQGLEEVVSEALATRGETVAVAESCTGGLLGAALSACPGSSRSFLGGVLAYSNEVKEAQLGVEPRLLREYGAVSEPVARAMAEGVRARLGSDWALSVTGIAGPDGGTVEKPVGTVFVALAGTKTTHVLPLKLRGDRTQNRQWSVAAALDLLRREMKQQPPAATS
jgi:nicotinamide-nucleotide amidase